MSKLHRIDYKEYWEEFQASFERRQLQHLYHFTSLGNLPSICRSPGKGCPPGLYSRKQMEQLGISCLSHHGWGKKARKMEDYICLCFHLPRGLVAKQKREIAVLLIDLEVIGWRDTCYCGTNSASSRISSEEIFATDNFEAFEGLFRGDHGPELKYRQSEILVKGHIPMKRIRKILLPDSPGGRKTSRTLNWIKWKSALGGQWRFPKVRIADWRRLN